MTPSLPPIALIPLVALVTGLAQIPLSRYINENLRESSLRQGLLIESLASVETQLGGWRRAVRRCWRTGWPCTA